MITAEWKPIPELVEKLKGKSTVLLIGCATCVAECAAGGQREVETLAPLLKMALAKEGQETEFVTAVLERQCEREFVDKAAEMVDRAEAVMSLACGIGVQAMAERYPDKPIYPGVNTTSLAIREQDGLWMSRCAACGDCQLDLTMGLCPIARCAKSIQNGPCGGTRDGGKCEVNEETDCVWNLIIERATARGELDRLMTVRQPKSWSNSVKSGPKRTVREDLRP